MFLPLSAVTQKRAVSSLIDGWFPFASSKDCGDTGVKCPARPVGRGGNTEAGAIANFINLVEKVEAVKTQLQFADARTMHMPNVLHAHIFRPIGGKFFKIREAGAQAIAIK